MADLRPFAAGAICLFSTLLLPVCGLAQTSLTSEGVAGDIDKYHRAPLLTVRPEISNGTVTIFADASIDDPDYAKYPIQFDFFINRRLFASQMRSPELPGAIGVDIGPDVAVPPFNYIVVASLMHPNRTFRSLIQGAVFGTSLSAVLDCTLLLPAELSIAENDSSSSASSAAGSEASDPAGEVFEPFVANNVTSLQTGPGTFTVKFEGDNSSKTERAGLSITITVAGDNSATATGTLDARGSESAISLSGTVELDGNQLQSVTLSTADGERSVSCS